MRAVLTRCHSIGFSTRSTGSRLASRLLLGAALALVSTAAAPADETLVRRQHVVSVQESFAESAARPVTSKMRPAQIIRRGDRVTVSVMQPVPRSGGTSDDSGAGDAALDSVSTAAAVQSPGPLAGETFQRFDGPIQSSFSFPPDPHMAVGSNHVVAVTNDEVVVYSKSGQRLFSQSWPQFFQAVDPQGNLDIIFDPKVIWDNTTNRFFLVIIGGEGNPPAITASHYLIAVTQTADATAVWRKFDSESTSGGSWSDYPGFAVDSSSLYVTANYFSSGTGQSTFSAIRVYPKAQLLSGINPPQDLDSIDNTNVTEPGQGAPDAFTIQPSVSYDASDVEWFVSSRFLAFNEDKIFLYNLNGKDAPRAIRKFTITLPNNRRYTQPSLAVQPDGTPVDSLDGRVVSAFRFGTHLWAAHVAGGTSGNDAEVRWYEFDISNTNAPALRQSGVLQVSNGSCINPAIATNAGGDAVVTFSRCTRSGEFLSMYYAARGALDPLGLMPTVRKVEGSNSSYPFFRWGDYAGASVDPLDNSTIWLLNELPGTGGTWKTTIARVPLGSTGGGGSGGAVCPQTLELVSPQGGENWVKGFSQQIAWQGDGTDQPDVLLNVLLARYNPDTQTSDVIGFFRNGDSVLFPASTGGITWNVDDPLIIDPAGNLNDPANQVDVSDSDFTSGEFADYQIVVQTAFLCPPGSGGRLQDASVNFFRISDPLSVLVTASDSIIERGESVTLAATPAGGKPPYNFRWTPGEHLDNPNIFRPIATPPGGIRSGCDPDLECVTYTVEVTDSTGPQPLRATGSIVVRISDPLLVDAGPTKSFLLGATVLLEGSASGGGKPYTYLWNPIPDPTQPPGSNGQNLPQPIARPTTDTVYNLTVTDRFGTVRSDTVQVLQGYTLSIVNQPAGAGSVARTPVKSLYIPGEQISFTANPSAGFQFLRWEIGPAGGQVSQFSERTVPIAMPAATLNVTAVYVPGTSGSSRPTTGSENPDTSGGGTLPVVACGPAALASAAPIAGVLLLHRVVRRRRRR
ncbi:MAG: hypothetical protein U1A27_10415 [Phycisphaerae bacterium]